ncbi:hypothetical protein [Pedobacter paludis]|uniref:Uncharacterized protein n=1 Tax=Pedobacter paludis TaxID=2203212 RepID=A0A317EW37_9SPHI|nr:hypothetical protein [Pedobacter paludis]PWS30173.1 hypothetical protein DF947_19625 [Pedobacter paludis]
MNELINQLNYFFGDKSLEINLIGPAEINIVLKDQDDAPQLSQDLQNHIVQIVNEDTLAKINFVNGEGKTLDSFALNQ